MGQNMSAQRQNIFRVPMVKMSFQGVTPSPPIFQNPHLPTNISVADKRLVFKTASFVGMFFSYFVYQFHEKLSQDCASNYTIEGW